MLIHKHSMESSEGWTKSTLPGRNSFRRTASLAMLSILLLGLGEPALADKPPDPTNVFFDLTPEPGSRLNSSGQTVTGDYNLAIGIGSGNHVTGNNNTVLGHNSGNTVTGSGNIAVGLNAGSSITADNTISIGTGATASASNAIAIGTGNTVSGANSGAFGDPNNVSGTGSYAFGNNNTIANDYTFVLGNGVTTTQDYSVVLGNLSADRAPVVITGATIGSTVYSGFYGTAIGVVSVGAAGAERQIINVAPGEISATSTDAINGSQLYSVLGSLGAEGDGESSTWYLTGNGLNSTSVGDGDTVDLNNTDGNIVVTKDAADNDVTFDLAKEITVDSVTAGDTLVDTNGVKVDDTAGKVSTLTTGGLEVTDGTDTATYGADGVTFGSGSVSLSKAGLNNGGNTITGVAQGVNGTDAVNVNQLNSANSGLTTAGLNFTDATGSNVIHKDLGGTLAVIGSTTQASGIALDDSGAATAGAYSSSNVQTYADETSGQLQVQFADAPEFSGDVTAAGYHVSGSTVSLSSTGLNNGGNKITGVLDGIVAEGSTDAVNGGQLYAISQLAGGSWDMSTGAVGTGVVIGSTLEAISSGEEVTFQAGNNMVVNQSGNTVTYSLNPELKDITSIRVTGGPTINSSGINMNGDKIVNLAAGQVSATSTDAVNGSQLYATNQIVEQQGESTATILGGGSTYNSTTGAISAPSYFVQGDSYNDVGSAIDALDSGLTGLDSRVSSLDTRLDRVGAMSAALSGIQAGSFTSSNPTEIGVAGGAYNGKYAMALGMNHHASQRVLFNLGAAMSGGEVMGRAGVTIALGSKQKKPAAEPVSSELQALRTVVNRQNDQLSRQDGQIQLLMQKIAELENKVAVR